MDVIEEILTRLPVKHVLRCKLLSKSCYHLIENPSFIKKHLLRGHQSDSSSKIIAGKEKSLAGKEFSCIVYTLPWPSTSRLSIPHQNMFTLIVGSCNGLLVFSSSCNESADLMLYNPATRKYLSVPKPPLEHMLKSNHIKVYTSALGFAHDAKSGDYKLIKIGKYNIHNTYSCLIQVWSMNANSWKQMNSAPIPRLISENRAVFRFGLGLLVNGILYWLVGRNGTVHWHDPTILCFDPTNDRFGEIALPKQAAQPHSHRMTLIDFTGSLALSLSRLQSPGFHYFDIWVMSGDSLWTKKFSIGPYPAVVRTTQMCINGNFVLCDRRNVFINLGSPMESREDCKIILCNPHRNEVETSEVTVTGFQTPTTAWSLCESLVSLPQTTCSNKFEEEVVVVNKLLRMPLLGVFLGCVGLSLHLLLRTRC